MPFKKGDKRPPGAGRRPGQTNKATADIKAMIEKALKDAGGAAYLQECATSGDGKVQAAFLSLVGKLIPRDIKLGLEEKTLLSITRSFVRTHGQEKG